MQDQEAREQLVDRLFVPHERWGWEYAEPVSYAPSPFLQQRPVWQEPVIPDLYHWEVQYKKGLIDLPIRLLVVVAVVILLFLIGNWLGYLGLLVGLVIVIGYPIVLPALRIRQARRAANEQRTALYTQFQLATQQWEQHIAAHNYREYQRTQSQQAWYPLQPLSGPSRVDIFGGTPSGWASLLTTLGGSLLYSSNKVLILDFSEHQLARELADFASTKNLAVSQTTMPDNAVPINLLGALAAEDLAELLAEAIHTMRPPGDNIDLRTLDAELLNAVTKRLTGPATFTRLVAGIKVLRRVYDVRSADGVLSTEEIRNLTADIDTLGHTERTQQELQFLSGVLDLLSTEDSSTPAQPTLWNPSGLTVINTITTHQRRKDFLDRVLAYRVLHELRAGQTQGRRGVLVIAGADHLGLATLEMLARQTRRTGVQLVLMIEHLRGDITQLLGGSDSATILMRLGNAQEAAAAAEFIGRGYKFVLNQITKQVGSTFTDGISEGDSFQLGTNYGESTNLAGGHGPATSKSTGTSISESRSRSWQSTRNYSLADSTSTSDSRSRVYEFAVEPTEIQGLPPTAFILVEPGRTGRRIVVGDCNPGITLLDRVAVEPRRQ